MDKSKIVCVLLLLISLLANVFIFTKSLSLEKELNDAKKAIEVRQNNGKIINFTQLFIANVLQADKEVDFEKRLQLENTVREIEDEDILNQWKKFINSKEEKEAQKEAANLLDMLLKKIGE